MENNTSCLYYLRRTKLAMWCICYFFYHDTKIFYWKQFTGTLEFVKGLRSDKAIHTFGKYATHADQLNKEYTRDRLKKHYLNKETIQ